MKLFILIFINISLVIAVPSVSQRIVGGSVTSIDQRPYLAALLYSRDFVRYSQSCGGSIITTTAILSAAHCFIGDTTHNWRIRVGSTNANSGGVVHNLNRITIHELYNRSPFDNDVAILRTTNAIAYNANVQPARIASTSYVLADNAVVWAIGWGTTSEQGSLSEQLRHVQIWTVNQAICKSRYAGLVVITDNMLCSGWLDVGGRDQCQGDSGGPLVHDNVVVGIASFGNGCARPNYPGVNARVSRLAPWIQNAALA